MNGDIFHIKPDTIYVFIQTECLIDYVHIHRYIKFIMYIHRRKFLD